MQKLLSKITAVIITTILITANLIPTVAIATDNKDQNAKTTEENVEFNATINNGYNASIDIDAEGVLNLNVKVSGTGYLKESEVTLEGNNYEIIDRDDLNVKSIDGNVIKLNEVNVGETLNIALPIKLNKEERVSSDILGKDSTVTFDAIYVNHNGKERKIKKTLTEHVEWTAELNEVVTQDLVRYIKYDDNKTMVSFKVKDGIENNKMPVTNKEITISVPTLANTKPSNVIVTGEGITYKYENNTIKINKVNTPDQDGKIKWNSDDEYMITYVYDVQSEDTTIKSQVSAKAEVKGNAVEGKLENDNYNLSEQVGQYVEATTLGTSEINKGYMYTNLRKADNNLETPFEVKVKANVGFKDVTDSVKIVETDSKFNDLDASNSLKDRKVRIDKDNLTRILGEEGTIKVLSADGKELGTLSKDSLELELDQEKIVMQTSKVLAEGDLELVISKVITANNQFTKNQIQSFTELKSNYIVEGYKDENKNSSKEVTYLANFTEPTSNAQMDVSVQNLSTIVKNENVVITATLKTNDITDALYTNAKVNIVLPEEVKEINVKEAGLIYEDELVLENLKVNQNSISLDLNGIQTKYSNQSTSNGTVVRLVTDLTLDNLAPTNEKMITLNYSNESTGEQNSVDESVGIVAPTGFVTTNSIEVNGQKVTSQESDEKIARINVNDNEKTAKVSATIVNNLGKDVEGFTVVGTIPTTGNKSVDGKDLGSNFDTALASEVKVEGIDAKVYYSENANETINGNSWSETYSANAKVFKIVANRVIPQIASMNYSYDVVIPANLTYGKVAKTSYAVYYNNGAEQGYAQDYIIAKSVGLTTGEIPVITAEGVFVDTNSGEVLSNEANVKEGRFLTYRLKLTNTGKEDANNVKAEITLPSGLSIVEEEYDMSNLPTYTYDSKTKNISEVIDNLKVGETKTLEYKLVVTRTLSGVENENTVLVVNTNLTADKINENITSERKLKVVKGDISASVTSSKTNKTLKAGDEVEYYLNIRNANFEEKTNIKATITLPREFEVTSVMNNEGTKYEHDKNSNVITYTNELLSSGSTDGLYIKATVKEFSKNVEVNISTKISCDQMDKEDTLETIKYNLSNDTITVSQSSNIAEGNFSDTDELEYYIDVKNNGSERITVSVRDSIPEGLRVLEYETKDVNGTKKVTTGARDILASLEINGGETARLTIRTKPYLLEKGRIQNIENKASVDFIEESVETYTNTLKHTIIGTSDNSSGSSTNPEGTPGTGDENIDTEIGKEGTYRINGTVWFDENENGRKEETEQRFSGLTVKLFNKATGKIALDVDGKELTKTTNESGTYTFINVVPGSYIVVVEFDSINYKIATYRVADVIESENSDFISAKLGDKDVAATDELRIADSNIYNIDLGLVRNKIFDLDINKTVTRISVANTKDNTKIYDFDSKSITKVELASKNVDFATVLIEYTIRIENNGQISGYAKSIVDHIPEGMTFNSELNSTWYLGQDGDAYNTSLANTIINPGEVKEVKLVLSRKMSGENTGTVRNTAEILTAYNEFGLVDIDAQSGNIENSQEDKSAADVIIGMATGREIASFTGITLGILAIIALAVYEIKKHVISKMYNYLERR